MLMALNFLSVRIISWSEPVHNPVDLVEFFKGVPEPAKQDCASVSASLIHIKQRFTSTASGHVADKYIKHFWEKSKEPACNEKVKWHL